MTAPTLPGLAPDTVAAAAPRPGSRAARMLHAPRQSTRSRTSPPTTASASARSPLRRTDLDTGQTEIIDLPCGATQEAKCPPCAKRARRLRQQQIREGWHRDDEPDPGPRAGHRRTEVADRAAGASRVRPRRSRPRRASGTRSPTSTPRSTNSRTPSPPKGSAAGSPHPTPPTRTRTTRRRQAAEAVHPPAAGRPRPAPAAGRARAPSAGPTPAGTARVPAVDVADPDPRLLRPVHTDGTPVDPDSYDYRRAAWDAVHFARLLDRFWQNLRRAVGWNVQYAGCVEPQRRLAPHAHFAIRGTIPRAAAAAGRRRHLPPGVVAAASTQLVYDSTGPRSGTTTRRRTSTRTPGSRCRPGLTPWTLIDATPTPNRRTSPASASQVDAKGVIAGHRGRRPDASATSPSTSPSTPPTATRSPPTGNARTSTGSGTNCGTPRARERCANWLLYGVQPKKAHGRLQPGNCKGKVHQRDTLGFGGRRVLDLPRVVRQDPRRPPRRPPAWVNALLGVTTDADHRRPVGSRTASGTPGNSPNPPTPTCHRWNTASCAPSPNASNGATNSTPPDATKKRPPP